MKSRWILILSTGCKSACIFPIRIAQLYETMLVPKLARNKQVSAHTYRDIWQVSFMLTQRYQIRGLLLSCSVFKVSIHNCFTFSSLRSIAELSFWIMVTNCLWTKAWISQKQKATKFINEGVASHMSRYLMRRNHLQEGHEPVAGSHEDDYEYGAPLLWGKGENWDCLAWKRENFEVTQLWHSSTWRELQERWRGTFPKNLECQDEEGWIQTENQQG